MSQLMPPPVTYPPVSSGPAGNRGTLLMRVFAALDKSAVKWCVLHGYQSYPAEVPSDVDLLMPPGMLPDQLAELLRISRSAIGAEVSLWLDDGAQYIVLTSRAPNRPPLILQLHVNSTYSLSGRKFYHSAQILDTRVRRDGFWTPCSAIEFACVLINRTIKQNLRPEHQKQLAILAEHDPEGCQREASRFFPPASAARMIEAIAAGKWDVLQDDLPAMREQLLAGSSARPAGGAAAAIMRRLRRWLRPPCGLHLVFLGPDGVGKSTVIESVKQDLFPIFLSTRYLTFAPSLLPSRFETPKPDGPHSLPPRSWAVSMVKAAWWSICYTAGYYLTIHPALARAGLVINHRYLPDAIVDSKRYRYSGPQWVLRALWRVAPKPHLLFLLDAPAEVIQARKKEVHPEETRRQREAYLELARPLRFAHVIDASQPLARVVEDVENIVLNYLAARVTRQRGKAAR